MSDSVIGEFTESLSLGLESVVFRLAERLLVGLLFPRRAQGLTHLVRRMQILFCGRFSHHWK
jgi:hypothetical protein